jgi:hypothetical protein
MRATKGLWAALGAGVSLAAAGLIALAMMGVVLAVGGWPKGHYVTRDGSATLQAQRAAARAVLSDSSTPASVPAHSAHRARSARRATAHRVAVRRQAQRHQAVAGPGSAKVVPASPSTDSAPNAASAPSTSVSVPTAPVTTVTGSAGGSVTQVTDTAGQVLDPVSQPVANTVTAVGQQAGQTLDQVGQTVGGVVGGLIGQK